MKKLLLTVFVLIFSTGLSQAIIIDDFTEDTNHTEGWFCLSSPELPQVLTDFRTGTAQHIIGGRCDITLDVTALGLPESPMVCYDVGGCDPDFGCWPANATYDSFFDDRAVWSMEYGKQSDLNANLTCGDATSIKIDFNGDMDGNPTPENPNPPIRPVPTTITLISGKNTPQQATASKTLDMIYDGTLQFPFTDFPGINFADIDYIGIKLAMDTVQTDAVDFIIYKIYTTGECTPTLITLSSFTAKGKKLEWVTESEIDNAGFNIWRAEAEAGPYVQLNDEIIPAKGSATQGAKYTFTDKTAQGRNTYFYKLQDIDVYGTSTFHGPVSTSPRFLLGIFNK
jgi:hypothetical protein